MRINNHKKQPNNNSFNLKKIFNKQIKQIMRNYLLQSIINHKMLEIVYKIKKLPHRKSKYWQINNNKSMIKFLKYSKIEKKTLKMNKIK